MNNCTRRASCTVPGMFAAYLSQHELLAQPGQQRSAASAGAHRDLGPCVQQVFDLSAVTVTVNGSPVATLGAVSALVTIGHVNIAASWAGAVASHLWPPTQQAGVLHAEHAAQKQRAHAYCRGILI